MRRTIAIFLAIFSCGSTMERPAYAVDLPSHVDAGRIHAPLRIVADPASMPPPERIISQQIPLQPIPDGAFDAVFSLKHLTLEGVTAFTHEQMHPIYADSLSHPIRVSDLYVLAQRITQYYREAGYFLAIAYVPEQSIDGGKAIIRVEEGFLSHVVYHGPMENHSLIQAYLDRIRAQRPISKDMLERTLLQLNDLPSLHFRAILSHEANDPEEGMTLTLVSTPKKGRGTIGADNYRSRFLGPHAAYVSYSTSILPLQQTSFSVLQSLPHDRQKAYMMEHNIPLLPDLTLRAGLQYSAAKPGYNLKDYAFESESTSASLGFSYQWVRSREHTMALTGTFDRQDSSTDALSEPFSRDHVRALRVGFVYDGIDKWGGSTALEGVFSQGIHGMGSSRRGDEHLSREEARPDFRKLLISASRSQAWGRDWSLFNTLTGQIASGPLYSSEELGYGGQAFGPAYDESDFVGDEGVITRIELRYHGLDSEALDAVQPYVFYDYGMVWNKDVGQSPRLCASSTGAGIRAATRWGQTASTTIAFPLAAERSAPIYGRGGKDPRLLLQFSQDF